MTIFGSYYKDTERALTKKHLQDRLLKIGEIVKRGDKAVQLAVDEELQHALSLLQQL